MLAQSSRSSAQPDALSFGSHEIAKVKILTKAYFYKFSSDGVSLHQAPCSAPRFSYRLGLGVSGSLNAGTNGDDGVNAKSRDVIQLS